MNKAKACSILGVEPDVPADELKKRYRFLMMLTHPDSAENDEEKHIDRLEDTALLADITYMIAGQFFGVDMALSLMKHEETEDTLNLKIRSRLD